MADNITTEHDSRPRFLCSVEKNASNSRLPEPIPNLMRQDTHESESLASEKIFFDVSKEFITQAISGVLVACKRMQMQCSNDIFKVLLAEYLNSCYHSYFKHDDEYITSIYSKIFTETNVKSIICFSHWVLNIGDHMYFTIFEQIKHTSYTPHNLSGYRTALKLVINLSYDKFVNDFISNGNYIKCCGKIEITDDGKDIFTIS